MEKLVSIIVPIFNGGNYILDFLESIKNQNYSNIQLILRDDRSSDNSYLLCERWKQNNEKNFEEILLLRGNKNVGLVYCTVDI